MSDIGTFLQTVGAAWLMVSLGAGLMYVALIQTASALPFFVFAVPAGADIVDRRRLILYTEFWMVGVATVLTVVTREDLAAASALNGIEFNVARAVGPPFWLGPSAHVPGMRAHACCDNSPNRHATKHALLPR